MVFSFLLEVVAAIAVSVFASVCFAAGVEYLSDLAEEYTRWSRVYINILFVITVVLRIGKWIEGYPFWVTAVGLLATAVYSTQLPNFPVTSIYSVSFILCCAMMLTDVAVAAMLLNDPSYMQWTPSSDLFAYVFVCVIALPMSLFVTLQASEDNIPTSQPQKRVTFIGSLKGFFGFAGNSVQNKRFS